MVIPGSKREEVEGVLSNQPVYSYWNEEITDERTLMKILLSQKETENVMDTLEKKFSDMEEFRMLLLNVEASVPRQEKEEENNDKEEKDKTIGRISREELYSDISDSAELSWVYIGMIVFSAIIASVGILRTNIVVIIGAMIIAPMIGPNIALALSTTLGDVVLARKSVITNSTGIIIAFLVSALLGYFINVSPDISSVIIRARLGIGDIVLALSVGSAGALAYTSGLSSNLVGVMVAVALLPPLVTTGLLTGAGYFKGAFDSLLLFITNLICVNFSAVITFLISGIRPVSWWEADRAKKATTFAIILWIILLSVLLFIILFVRKY